jgi:tetratricopeptide (TPR) repeat protein
MQLSFRSPAKKWATTAAIVMGTAGYCGVAASRFLADRFAQSNHESYLLKAIRFDPNNAEYRYNFGVRQLALQSPATAAPWLESATKLNFYSAKQWIALAVAKQLLGDLAGENTAINNALAVDSHSPDIAWQAANLLLAQGQTDAAMKQFHTVLQNDPPLTWPAITTAWKIHPDVDSLLENVVPPAADIPFLQFLLSNHETAAAGKVWDRIFSLQQPIDRRYLLEYEHYLLARQEVAQASLVWQQASRIADIAAYQPSPENLLVNGDFSLDILNGGFDWIHQPVSGVSIALDAGETHSSSRSLRIVLDGAEISDAGISQFVNLEPNTRYDLTALYKARDMDGAGGVHFAIHDAYRSTPLFLSEDLRDADFWKNAGGTFTTPADTHLAIVHVIRVPAGRPIRGKLWIDGLRLVQSGTEGK